MAKRLKKKDMDQELLNALYQVEGEWRQLQDFVRKSIDPSRNGMQEKLLAKSKYLMLLREARVRNVKADRF
ncbi:YaaL family protein [Oceanobacillus sojae]|uniref:YaaL family protein n=1 Tax=Oceanobacillus sojae TaxID=582851 RepID=UPI0009885CF8|nr:YaaL family protein [Oceanobacillus sojae]MCT1901782.1 YaaL family protein [Oceanobacillus sojae]